MYFVTVSEMIGTNGEIIAREVAKKINYPFYAKEELFEMADKMGFLSDITHLKMKSPHLLEKYFCDKPKIYLDRFQSVIYEMARKGNALFFGKGSQLLLHSFDCALHVLVTGSMEKRIQRIMEAKKVAHEVAQEIIHTSDHDKVGFLKYAFNRDWLDPHLYDLILNTDKLSVESSVKMIVDGAQSDEIKVCTGEAVDLLGKMSLHRKIESALIEAGVLSLNVFFVIEGFDSVRFYGVVNSPEEIEAITMVVKGIKEIKKIKNDLTVFQY
ncbi:MAG: cytidylate kinase-like family protein [Pseudomonadota bacterium]